MKNKIFYELMIICIFTPLLTGCSSVKEWVTREMWNRSGIEEDTSYIQFRQMESASALDEQGFYRSKEIEEYQNYQSALTKGPIHISFAHNDFLNFSFYRDAAMDDLIDPLDCRLNPGDEIYASAPELTEAAVPFYQFSEIRILELDEKGTIKQQLASAKELPGSLWHIPEDFTGTEVIILPLGEYRDRIISMNAVYVHPDGRETELDRGTWLVEEKRYGNGSAALNPTESYRIVYDYSPYMDDLYYAGSSPASYWENSGSITFLSEPTDGENQSFQVYLHPYGTLEIHNGVTYQNAVDSILESASAIFRNKGIIETKNIITLLQVNGVPVTNNFSDTEMTVSKLKAGDDVLIRVPENLKLIAEGFSLPSPQQKEDIREYRFTIPDTEDMKFRLNAGYKNTDSSEVFHERVIEHGTLSVFDNSGIRYTEGSELPAGSERVKIVIEPDNHFCVYGRNVKNNVYESEMKYDDFNSEYESILAAHPIKPEIVVTLDSEDELGECVFWTGNEKIDGTIALREGQDLQFDFLLDPESGYEITLSEDDWNYVVNVWSPYAASRVLDVTDELQEKTIRCRDFITIKEGVKKDDGFEDLF